MKKTDFAKIYPELSSYYAKLDALCKMVEEKSTQVNITAIKDYESIWAKHILDSLVLLNAFKDKELQKKGLNTNLKKIIDLGTGAGFPGIPLAITLSNTKFVLLDGTRKKISIVNEFLRDLDIKNALGVWGRAEEVSSFSEYRESFDLVVSRGVSFLPGLIQTSKGFLHKNGIMALYKNKNDDELKSGLEFIEGSDIEYLGSYDYNLADFIKLEEDLALRTIYFFRKI